MALILDVVLILSADISSFQERKSLTAWLLD